ncbi:MAG: putative quinol monooxygenase [Eubacteriales bacterium]|nr:putative quinol monooxygenase [Eubacteriales bacterium]
MICLYVSCPLKPGCGDAFIEATRELVAQTRLEPGNISYAVGKEEGSDDTYVFVESWKDAQALDDHGKLPHFTRGMAAIAPLLAGKPTAHKAVVEE